jgi:hypothetical protein
LALFGRRPPQRVEGFVMPASKNLHITGSQLISVAKPVRFYQQKAARFSSSSSHNGAPILIRSLFGGFWIDG